MFARARRTGAGAALLVALAAAPAWGGGGLPVAATSTDLAALVAEVGGADVSVESLAPPGADPHAVEVKPGQRARLREARLLVAIGLDHEPWLRRLLAGPEEARFRPGGQDRVDVARGLELLGGETARVRPSSGVHLHAFGNPHVWLDPANARPITAAIEAALAARLPARARTLAANRVDFLARLDAALPRWEAALAAHRGTRAVAAHDTWPYFARRFGLVLVDTLEPTPGVPPTPASLAGLAERMRSNRVALILSEPGANAAAVAGLARATGARTVTLVPSVGGAPEARDYLGLIDLNVRRLAAALAAR